MPNEADLTPQKLVATAHLLADESGPVILEHFRTSVAVDNKAGPAGFDPVTEADRAAERAIRARLGTLHPDHGILGEEMGLTRSDSPYTWVIDPIDGTRAFITGMPLWGTLIGVTERGRAVAGLMDQPYTRERIWSGGDATYWRSTDGGTRPVRTSPCGALADARLTTTSPDLFVGAEREVFDALKAEARLTRFGGDCYAYCLLAAGHIDIIVEAGLKAYDIVALVPIIEAAGGVVTTWDGGRPEQGGRILACGDARLHAAALAITSRL
jgi:myo-inositol-1(or 4)-monophosphatase